MNGSAGLIATLARLTIMHRMRVRAASRQTHAAMLIQIVALFSP